jgi:hypothetical protein
LQVFEPNSQHCQNRVRITEAGFQDNLGKIAGKQLKAEHAPVFAYRMLDLIACNLAHSFQSEVLDVGAGNEHPVGHGRFERVGLEIVFRGQISIIPPATLSPTRVGSMTFSVG